MVCIKDFCKETNNSKQLNINQCIEANLREKIITLHKDKNPYKINICILKCHVWGRVESLYAYFYFKGILMISWHFASRLDLSENHILMQVKTFKLFFFLFSCKNPSISIFKIYYMLPSRETKFNLRSWNLTAINLIKTF